MKTSSSSGFLNELGQGLGRLLRYGNGLISPTGEPRYAKQLSERRLYLDKGDLHSFEPEKEEIRITVLSGSFWITLEGDPKDYVLQAGEYLLLPQNRKSVIEALKQGALEIKLL